MAIFQIDFATVRQLEKRTFRIFACGGAVFPVGLLFAVVGLAIIGVPLMLISGCGIIAAIVWVSMLGKEPTNQVFCPYCSSANDVYASRQVFECDICRRLVKLHEGSEPAVELEIDNGRS